VARQGRAGHMADPPLTMRMYEPHRAHRRGEDGEPLTRDSIGRLTLAHTACGRWRPGTTAARARTRAQVGPTKEMSEMPKTSREKAAHVDDLGIAEDRHDALDGYTVDFTEIRQDMDLTPLLKGLPDDLCHCPHWGYVFKGRITVNYADRAGVFEAGDAFYMSPGHASKAEAGSEFLQFSPTEELAASMAVMMKNMQAMRAA
jgi:hypothetical protein